MFIPSYLSLSRHGIYYLRWPLSYGEWLAAPRQPEFFREPRLLFREITDPKTGLLHVGYADSEAYNNPSIINCIAKNKNCSLYYLLGVCNSKLLAYYHFAFSPKAQKGVFPKILVNDVRNLPICKPTPNDSAQKKLRDQIAKLAEQMIVLTKEATAAVSDGDRAYYEGRRNSVDAKIDKLVYQLYRLTEEEIQVVENFGPTKKI